MAFLGTFIGINRHEDPGIPELTGATRDASALYALFVDTFSGMKCDLLLDQAATLSGIREVLDRSLAQATADDVVVLSFAGHGTRGHQIVAYDTDRDSPGDTTLPMEELADRFRSTKARAVLCIVDCCFSGATPARVLDATPASRADLVDYSAFEGKGRFLLAAASPSQPAWEEPGSGHGLLTRSAIEVLTCGSGTNDITQAVGGIIARTRELALEIGQVQDACFVGSVEGGLALPVLNRGSAWQKLFPDLSSIEIDQNVGELARFNVPKEVIEQWQAKFPDGLNKLQLEAINKHRVLNGESLLVVAPTSSGKTFIGELAAIRAAIAGQKAVFLLPYRALVNEKYEDFLASYSTAGLRVIRCAGDFTDETGLFLAGRYDLAILTFEMFLGLAVSSPHVVKKIGALVLDEAQFITDPMRGISVELLLSLVLFSRSQGVHPQLVALSAVIGDVNKFDEWLACRKLIWTQRPVPLTEGVLDRSGTFQALNPDGTETETQLLPRHLIQQRRSEPSSQDIIVPLARSLITAGEKLLIFRNTRGPAEGCAAYLAKELGLPPAKAALGALPSHDLSGSARRLRECLSGGTAFHNSNLNRDERVVIERNFRNPKRGIEALAATTTLAAGINTPASTVILAEQEFVGEDGRPFTVAEYKNIAGRAGRLGFNETGKAIILANNSMERRQLFARYVKGAPDPIKSSFADGDLRTWVIRLLSQVHSIEEHSVPSLLASTYGGFLAASADPAWKQKTETSIAQIVQQFVQLGLLERHDDKVQLSLLGRACGQSSLSFDSAMRLIEAVRSIPSDELSAFRLVGLLQMLPEADRLYTPVRKKARIESARVDDARRSFGHLIIQALQRLVPDEYAFWARCKRAAILGDWMVGASIQDIEQKYTVPFGGQVQSGDILRYADGTRFHLYSAHQILSALLAMNESREREFDQVLGQLEYGVPTDLIPMMVRPFLLSRGEVLALADRGVRSVEVLLQTSEAVLQDTLGRGLGSQIAEICEQERKNK
ncbi:MULTISPECIES: DEAD/DEAH box helicase [unclassified Bradyrhizobium]